MSVESTTSAHNVPLERARTVSIPWHFVALSAILALTAALNFLQLDRIGLGNLYYATAVKSMLTSWHAFFFVSLDPGGFVSIDKPPVAFWVQAANAKIFGFNGVSLLLPQAVAGIFSVAILYALVGRIFGRAAGLIAALALAIRRICRQGRE